MTGSKVCLALGLGVMSVSDSGRGCLPLGLGSVCLWVQEVSASGSRCVSASGSGSGVCF